jgi:hypothetical protein
MADPKSHRCVECGSGTRTIVRERGVVESSPVLSIVPPPTVLPPLPVRPYREMGAGRVYFIGAEGDIAPIKIGFTTGPAEERRKQLQTGHPHRLRIWAVLEADFQYEQKIHHRFRESRLQGEWFSRTPDLLEFMATCARPVFFEHCYPLGAMA